VPLTDELAAAADAARRLAGEGEALAGVLAAEAATGVRSYLCAFAHGEERSWLVLDEAHRAVTWRERVRDTASIVAVCELAAETAGGGQLEELRRQLASLRLTEAPPGIEEAEAAALALERTLATPPRLASPAWLDEVGRLLRAGPMAPRP